MSQFTKKGKKHFIRESGSDISVDSEDVNKLFKQKQSPKWLHEDETDTAASSDLCKSHTYGPVHSTPTDSKKLTSYSMGTTDESLGVVRELDFQPKSSEDIKNTSEGTGIVENSTGEDRLTNVSVTSGVINEFQESKKEENVDLHSVSTKDFLLKETGSSHPVQVPGPDTLDEMADKQKFFSELEKEMSGTLDYGLLNRQMSKTSTQLATSSVDYNTKDSMKPQATGGIIRKNTSETSAKVELLKPLPQQQPSLLSKVMLLDSMGSSLNTTGTSAPAEVTSPAATKEGFAKTENQASQKDNQVFQGTVTNEEIKELHNALHNINLSSTLPANEILPSNNLVVENTKQPHYLVDDSVQFSNDTHLKNNTKEHIQNATLNTEAKENNTYESLVKESEKTELNQRISNGKSLAENSEGNIYGFDLSPVVIDNEPASSVSAPFEPQNIEIGTFEQPSLLVTDLSKTTNVSKKTNKYSNVPSSGYGWKTVSLQRSKTKTSVNSNKSAEVSKTSGTSQVALVKSKMELAKNTEKSLEQLSKYFSDSRALQPIVKKSTDADINDIAHPEVNILKKQLEEERELIFQLKVKIAGNENKYQQSIKQLNQQFLGEIEDLRKANYILVSKVSGENGKNLNEQEDHFQKELEEHQKLLVAYDAENKRLYNDAKQQKVLQKKAEERMFSENQKLLRELNSLRNQMNLKQARNISAPNMIPPPPPSPSPGGARNKDIIICDNNNNNRNDISKTEIINQSIVAFSAEKNQLEISHWKQQCNLLEQTNFELETQISKLVQQKEEMHQVLEEIKKAKDDEMKAVESKFFDDIESMKKKLHWYTYNQQLLDQSVLVLQQKDKEIEQLNLRIQKLSSETGKRFEENKLLGKERAVNQKRIQNLEHQIKEMEKIYCKRNPNSLPALLMAAGSSVEASSDCHQAPSPLNLLLEQKVQKLENQLKNAQEEGDLRVRTVEQKYNKLKLQYESQIETLEETVKKLQHQAILGRCTVCKKPSSEEMPEEPKTSENTAEDNSETTIKELQQNVDQLQSEVQKYKEEDDNLHALLQKSQNKETQLQNKMHVLQQQLDTSNNQVATLRCMFSKLQNEKQTLLRQQLIKKPTSTNEELNKKASKLPQKSKKSDVIDVGSILAGKEEKIISVIEVPEDILKENELLKIKVEQLQLSLEHQKVDMMKSSAELEADIRKTHEHYQDEINTLRISHQKELHKILTEQALKNSTSSSVQLQCKVDAQQVLIDHLQEQLRNAQVDAEKLSELKVREVVLEAHIQQLQDELAEAKSTHSPERQHFQSLVEKIQELEKKQDAREKEMLSVMKKGSCLPFSELEKEVEKWKKVAESKNADIEKYRVELDSMLSMLTSLKASAAFTSQNKYMTATMYR
ncbi:centrosomal protein of 162 kDa isoform X1 [Octopus sinensis]|uniref:Centrosomal protein of 162 kDa n=1 Tax=Octopus sinensis TaxID=2607531 RepID=A0A7E6EUG0_9MOLL|nr:centrosomal protein of 162 kDa isoform X1 [Octopus sinensis]